METMDYSNKNKIDSRQVYTKERAPTFIFSSIAYGQQSPPQSTVSPSTSFSSLDSGFIHGCSTPPPTPEEHISNGIEERLSAIDRQEERFPETSTPVLTRVSILRTSSQRLNLWNYSPTQKSLDRKDSVRFKLSLPESSRDISYSDSDSDSNEGFYSINTSVPNEKSKRKLKSKSYDENPDWEPVVKKLADSKHSIRYKIKPGYVSQMKKLFASQEDLHTCDLDTSFRKSNLKRHNSTNDISQKYVSVLKTPASIPQRTHSLSKIDTRGELNILRKSYDKNNDSAYSQSNSQDTLNVHVQSDKPRKTSAETVRKPTERSQFTNKNQHEHIGTQSYPYIGREQVSRIPVSRNRVELSDKSDNLNLSRLQKTHSQKVSNSTETGTCDGLLKSRNMQTDGLKEFLQKQYPNEDNSSHVVQNKFKQTQYQHKEELSSEESMQSEIQKRHYSTTNSDNRAEVGKLISKFGLNTDSKENWDERTHSTIETQNKVVISSKQHFPRHVKHGEGISPRRSPEKNNTKENDNNNVFNRNTNAHVSHYSNFQRIGSERKTSTMKLSKSANVRRTESVRSQNSSEALKSFLRKRYPSQEELLEEQQRKDLSHDSSHDRQDKAEIEKLVFKFGLGNKSNIDWDKKTKSKIDEHKNKITKPLFSMRQMDPDYIQCPTHVPELTPVIRPSSEQKEDINRTEIDIPQQYSTTHSSSHDYIQFTHTPSDNQTILVQSTEDNQLPLHSSISKRETSYLASSLSSSQETKKLNSEMIEENEHEHLYTVVQIAGKPDDFYERESEKGLSNIETFHADDNKQPEYLNIRPQPCWPSQTFISDEKDNVAPLVNTKTSYLKVQLISPRENENKTEAISLNSISQIDHLTCNNESGGNSELSEHQHISSPESVIEMHTDYEPRRSTDNEHSFTFKYNEKHVEANVDHSTFNSLHSYNADPKSNHITEHNLIDKETLNDNVQTNNSLISSVPVHHEPGNTWDISTTNKNASSKNISNAKERKLSSLELQQEQTDNDFYQSDKNLDMSVAEHFEHVTPKKTPPKKPPRKKKSNPNLDSIPFGEDNITARSQYDSSNDNEQMLIHDKTSITNREPVFINKMDRLNVNEQTIDGSTSSQGVTDTFYNGGNNCDGLTVTEAFQNRDNHANNKDEDTIPDYLQHIDICNMPIKYPSVNSNGQTQSSNMETTSDLSSSHVDGLQRHNEKECIGTKADDKEIINVETIQQDAVSLDLHIENSQERETATVSENHTKQNKTLHLQRSRTPEIDEDSNISSTNKYSENNETRLDIKAGVDNTDTDGSALDKALKDTEQQLCQTYLDLMDTWLAKRSNNRSVDTTVNDVDDWENVKSKLAIGTFVSKKEGGDSSSDSGEAESSSEGEYIVETSFGDADELTKGQGGSTEDSNNLSKFDENGDEVINSFPTICEHETDLILEKEENENTDCSRRNRTIDTVNNFNQNNFTLNTETNFENTDDLKSALKLNLDFLNETEDEVKDGYSQTSLLEVTTKTDLLLGSDNLSKVNKHIEDNNNTNTEHKPRRFVTFDVNTADDSKTTDACHTPGSESKEVDHVTTGKTLTPVNPHTNYKNDFSSSATDVHDESLCLNENFTSVVSNSSKIAILQELSDTAMPEKSSGNTKTSQMSEYTGGKKITTKTTTSFNKDDYGDEQTEQKRHLALLSDSIAKLNGENSDDILPEINQTITKLNGGNLVITTLTHKVVEEEDEDKDSSALVPVESGGRNSYIVQDHKGDTYIIEDITDENHESAYYGSSDHRYNSEYESMSSGSGSPQYHRIHNLKAHGRSGVDYNTAEEVILSLYNPYAMEYTETDDRLRSGQYSDERIRQGQGQLQPYGYNDSSASKQTTSYEYENGNSPHQQAGPYGSSSSKTVKQSYEMSSDGPWVTDGKTGYVGSQDVNMKKEVTNQSSDYDRSGMNAMSAAYMVEANSSVPQVNPYFVQQPLILPQIPVPQYNLLQLEPLPVKVTTGVQVTKEPVKQIMEQEQTIITGPDETDSKQIQERPVYKSVALVRGPYESPKWHTAKKHKPYEPPEDEVDSGRRFKVVKSSASDDVKEESMEYTESSKTITTVKTENVDISGGHYLDQNRNVSTIDIGPNRPISLNRPDDFREPRYTSEKTVTIGKKPTSDERQFRSTIAVNSGSYGGNKPRQYDHVDGYQSRMNFQQNYQGTPEPERKHYTDVERDMKVVRGNILIKNNFDEGLDEYNDNINVFDNGFNMSKQNPLYHSDEDIYKRYEEERRLQQERDMQEMENMAFETVDRFSKTKNVSRKADGERRRPPRSKENLTNLLLARLSTMDSKDIRQTLDVKHHHEDIYGDPHLTQAAGTSSGRITTSNYDTVTENVDLTMKDGKAFITITATAERLTPIDYEFHVWRKNQAIITRVVEIDFYADEQRRILYDRVMDRVDDEGYSENRKYSQYTRRKPQEIVLSSRDTLDLFNELMEATGGEGDKEDLTVKTKKNKTLLPENPFLY